MYETTKSMHCRMLGRAARLFVQTGETSSEASLCGAYLTVVWFYASLDVIEL